MDLISQAKKMQEKMKETQEALKKIEVEGVSGGNAVKVTMNGDGELKKISLDEMYATCIGILVKEIPFYLKNSTNQYFLNNIFYSVLNL